MSESKWMHLNSEAIAPEIHPADAAWATESPSSYDVPSHVRASYDQSSGCLIFEFKYIQDEPLTEVPLDGYTTAVVGRKTRRVWKIKLDVHRFNRDRHCIAQMASKSIQTASSDAVSNGSIAANVFVTKGDQLLEAVFR